MLLNQNLRCWYVMSAPLWVASGTRKPPTPKGMTVRSRGSSSDSRRLGMETVSGCIRENHLSGGSRIRNLVHIRRVLMEITGGGVDDESVMTYSSMVRLRVRSRGKRAIPYQNLSEQTRC